MSKIAKQEEARALRKQGKSIKEISINIGCPTSSVSRWVKHVELTKEQQEYLNSCNPVKNVLKRGPGGSISKALTWYERRRTFQDEGRELARSSDRDFIAGIMLYWAEGARSRNRNSVKFSNTSAPMVSLFMRFLKKYFQVEDGKIAVSFYCHLNNGLSLDDIETYWLKVLGLEKKNLRKSYIESKRIVSGMRKNVHPYGVCNLVVHDTRIIQQIYGAIQEYARFSEPLWVK
jgi:hypothetical protein